MLYNSFLQATMYIKHNTLAHMNAILIPTWSTPHYYYYLLCNIYIFPLFFFFFWGNFLPIFCSIQDRAAVPNTGLSEQGSGIVTKYNTKHIFWGRHLRKWQQLLYLFGYKYWLVMTQNHYKHVRFPHLETLNHGLDKNFCSNHEFGVSRQKTEDAIYNISIL